MASGASKVQLGFSEPIPDGDGDDDDDSNGDGVYHIAHSSRNWLDWDGGKIGGTPSWLNPRDLPDRTPFRCTVCASRNANGGDNPSGGPPPSETTSPDGGEIVPDGAPSPPNGRGTEHGTPLRFVAQIYSPADKATDNPGAFHRSLYVFCCPHPLCSSPPRGPEGGGGGVGSVLVLRGQLPRENDFYPFECGDGDVAEDDAAPGGEGEVTRTCAVCGQRATGRCPKSEQWFCGREHQREYHRASVRAAKSGTGAETGGCVDVAPCRYRETELVVEEEPPEEADGDGGGDGGAGGPSLETIDAGSLFPTAGSPDDDGDGDDADLGQDDLNDMTGLHAADGGTVDPLTVEFYTRIGRAGGDLKAQCLRYSRWPSPAGEGKDGDDGEDGPLWIGSRGLPAGEGGIPPCGNCGAERRFEFQLMPQMIHLLVNGGTGGGGEETAADGAAGVDRRREALLAASDVVERAGQEGGVDALPEGFRDRQRELVEEFRDRLFDDGDDRGGVGVGGGGIDWGTVAVYTCTKSCGGGGRIDRDADDSGLGAYREEFAWRQPPLDDGRK